MLLAAVEIGSGPPVALLHGLFGRAGNLGALARALAQRARVISLDLRNHGASPHAGGMSYPALAADVLETLESLGALPACILGHSMGGKTAMMAALTQPEKVAALIVADIAPLPYQHHNTQVARAMLALDLKPGLTRDRANAALTPDVPDPNVRSFLLQNLELGATPLWRIGLKEIAAGMADIEGWPDLPPATIYRGPTLFLTGANSDYVPPEAKQPILNRFPNAQFTAIPNAGHWLHADQPAAFTHAVTSFLDAASLTARRSNTRPD